MTFVRRILFGADWLVNLDWLWFVVMDMPMFWLGLWTFVNEP